MNKLHDDGVPVGADLLVINKSGWILIDKDKVFGNKSNALVKASDEYANQKST